METIPLAAAGSVWKFFLAGLAVFGGAVVFFKILDQANYRWKYTYSGIVFLAGFIPLWAGWRIPSALGLAPGVVELRYPGIRLTRRFKASETGVRIKHYEALYGDPERWSVHLDLPDGDDVFLIETQLYDEATAFMARIEAAAKPSAAKPAVGAEAQ